jgi:hypothetical protein
MKPVIAGQRQEHSVSLEVLCERRPPGLPPDDDIFHELSWFPATEGPLMSTEYLASTADVQREALARPHRPASSSPNLARALSDAFVQPAVGTVVTF